MPILCVLKQAPSRDITDCDNCDSKDFNKLFLCGFDSHVFFILIVMDLSLRLAMPSKPSSQSIWQTD